MHCLLKLGDVAHDYAERCEKLCRGKYYRDADIFMNAHKALFGREVAVFERALQAHQAQIKIPDPTPAPPKG